jgi:hypothetical protein
MIRPSTISHSTHQCLTLGFSRLALRPSLDIRKFKWVDSLPELVGCYREEFHSKGTLRQKFRDCGIDYSKISPRRNHQNCSKIRNVNHFGMLCLAMCPSRGFLSYRWADVSLLWYHISDPFSQQKFCSGTFTCLRYFRKKNITMWIAKVSNRECCRILLNIDREFSFSDRLTQDNIDKWGI